MGNFIKTKKVAIVGCGRISKRHIDAIEANNGIELSLICDIDRARTKDIAESLNVDFVTDIKDIRNVDVITIATPSGAHPEHVIKAAQVLSAHIIVCEKPVSLTVREVVEMYEKVEEAGKRFLPVYQNRYNPLIEFTKNLIDNNKLGKIFQFNVNVFWNRNDDYFKIGWHGTIDLDGGVLYTQASHYVDMLLHFFGTVKECKGLSGNLRRLEVQDSVSAAFKFEDGTVGSLNATVSAYRRNYLTELTIIGEKGTIRLSGTNLNAIDFWDVQDMEKPEIDFKNNNQYMNGHIKMYEYLVKERWEMFPTYNEVLSGITLMEKLSF